MNAKEKVDELIDNVLQVIPPLDDEGTLDYDSAKACALIIVEEILKECKFLGTADYRIPYWNEVKTEIEKL